MRIRASRCDEVAAVLEVAPLVRAVARGEVVKVDSEAVAEAPEAGTMLNATVAVQEA